jgi:hypothetical protein
MGPSKPCSIEVTASNTAYGRTRQRRRRIAVVFLIVVVVIIISLVVALAVVAYQASTPPHCDAGRGSWERDMEKPGLFNDLSPSEMRSVRDFLLGDSKLGLTPLDSVASVNSSYIFMIDLQVSQGGIDWLVG